VTVTIAAYYRKVYAQAITLNRSAEAWNETLWHFQAEGLADELIFDALYKAKDALGGEEGWKGTWWQL
jgi:hypothetical protein